MLTLKTTAHVDENGQLTLQLTEKLAPGEYDLVVVVDEKPLPPTQNTRKPLVFANHQFPLSEGKPSAGRISTGRMADRIFIDTNVLAFANNALSTFHRQAQVALQQYYQPPYELWVNRQVIREYLSVMSRSNPDPVKVVTPAILFGLQNLIAGFRIADENELVTTHLFSLLNQFPCGGKQVHDANIVATMQAYGISSLLTHNVADFTRFASLIQVIPLR